MGGHGSASKKKKSGGGSRAVDNPQFKAGIYVSDYGEEYEVTYKQVGTRVTQYVDGHGFGYVGSTGHSDLKYEAQNGLGETAYFSTKKAAYRHAFSTPREEGWKRKK